MAFFSRQTRALSFQLACSDHTCSVGFCDPRFAGDFFSAIADDVRFVTHLTALVSWRREVCPVPGRFLLLSDLILRIGLAVTLSANGCGS